MEQQSEAYAQIEVEIPCRLFREGSGGRGGGLDFEAFCLSESLGLGGVFLTSSFLLREGTGLWIELGLPEGPLAVKGRVSAVVEHDDPRGLPAGFGVEFVDVEGRARETLLRYFTPDRYEQFFQQMLGEFPHLGEAFKGADISLILNLWEEWKQTQGAGGPVATAAGAPASLGRRR